MIELNEAQRQALTQPGPIHARDPVTRETYVLVPASVYERFQTLFGADDSWGEDIARAAMEAFARDGWDDPRMDAYDALDPRIPQ